MENKTPEASSQKTTKCIIMSRVSTTIQELDIQEEECICMAERDGYTQDNMILIPRIGESARKVGQIITVETPRGPMEVELDRDGIWDMKKRIETDSSIDCVYIWEVSRLARRMDVLTPLLKYFADRKVQLRVKTNGISYLNPDKTVNPASKMTIEILGEVAEQEMNVKIERFKRSKKVMAEQGRFAGGKIPYGYSVDKEHGGVFVINEKEARIIHEIFDLYEAGITQPCIAREFYRRGMVDLNLSKVNNILTNEQYTGRWMRQGWSSYDRSYPVIISPEQYDHCREIAATNNTFANKCRSVYYAHKLLICKCGRKWGAGPSKVFYRCSEAYRTGNAFEAHEHQCDNKISISLNIIDSLLWQVAQEAEVYYIVNAAVDDKQKYQDQISVIDEKLGFIDTRLQEQDNRDQRISDLYEMGKIKSREELHKKYKEVADAKRAILQEQAALTNEREHLLYLCASIDTNFDLLDFDQTLSEMSNIIMLKEKIASITDDQQRYDIIHRHVRKVQVENSSIDYDFRYVGKKQPKTRFITVELYNGEVKYFQYIPFSGGKNTIMEASPDGTPICKYSYTYLMRFANDKKRNKRLEEKEQRKQAFIDKYPEDKYIISFAALTEFLGVERKMAYKLVNDGFLLPAKEFINKKKVAFNKEKCIELLQANANSNKWARKILSHIESK